MSPRPGGESDKFGNLYEGAWTVRHLLYILNGDGESITVEDTGDLAEKVEFTYRRPGAVEVHQLKRQLGLANSWSVKSLHAKGIWEAARHHVEAGREFHFVSMVSARVEQELCDFARRSGNLRAFIDEWLLNKELREAFDELSSSNMLGSPEAAWNVLRGTWFAWPDERDVIQMNGALAGHLLEGAAGLLAAVGLGDLVVKNLGVELTAAGIVDRLPPYGLKRITAVRVAALVDRVKVTTVSWSASVERDLLDPAIPREETAELVNLATNGESGLLFLSGAAGGGKSAVLYETVKALQGQGMPVLSFRLDRLEPFSSTVELGNQLGLGVSPVSALAAVAGERSSLLVIDQLDAVSIASGRMPRNFDVIADLVREAQGFGRMRVILACRKFDVDNDDRIRALTSRPDSRAVTVNALSDEQVDAAVRAMGLDPDALKPRQRELLRTPLHLVLLNTVASQPNALDFQTASHLFDAYWNRKQMDAKQRRTGTRFEPVISVLAEAMSARQRLSVPKTVLDQGDLTYDADVLVSEHVLVRDGRDIAFFHEAFFDYAFARQWVNRGEALVGFLTNSEQELFRRGQVRQIMTHLRDSDPQRFVDEVEALLSSDAVRFHVKDVALAVLGSLADPTSLEADMVLDTAATHPPYEVRLWDHLRTPAWFARFDTDGHIDDWLADGPEQQNRVFNFVPRAASAAPDRFAELLRQHRNHADYPAWLRWVTRFGDLSASRSLFELFVDAIRTGIYDGFEHELWLAVYELADKRPDWMVEVLEAFLVDRPAALTLNERGRVLALRSNDYTAIRLIKLASEGAPQQFCDALLPYLLRVMELTALKDRERHPRPDAQFSYRYRQEEHYSHLDDALFAGMTSAIKALVAKDPEAMRSTLERLAADPHDSAQSLLYRGLVANPSAYAEWAAELLLEGEHRLLCGYADNSVWATRELLQAITPVVSDELFGRLETLLRDLRFSWQRSGPSLYAFSLLSGLDESRLSELGRRRLAELRRAYGMQQPPEPQGVVTGFIGAPIPSEAAEHMSDDNWLEAMAKHSGEREDFRNFIGGAQEQSHVLKDKVVADPSRFARLALRITADINPAYGDAILRGFGDAELVGNEDLIFDAVRHIASLGHSDNDQWLGFSLRRYLKTTPLDLVGLIRDRAVSSLDPSDDGQRFWSEEDSRRPSAQLHMSGINTARGSLAEFLGDFLIYDVDGSRTSLVAPALDRLAGDPALPVRVCVAHTIAASLRFARAEATAAFWRLIETDDALLATDQVAKLIMYLGTDDPTAVQPVLDRMLASSDLDTREAGGQLAAVAALEWGMEDRLQDILAGTDSATRKGAAYVCAHRLRSTSNVKIAAAALTVLVDDGDPEVRKAAAEVAAALRGERVRPFKTVLETLLASPAFSDALPQLLITLEQAPDRVNDLVALCARRFVDVFATDAGDIRTGAAGDASEVAKLIIRGLAQSGNRDERRTLLDALDNLLLIGAYGVDKVVGESERQQR